MHLYSDLAVVASRMLDSAMAEVGLSSVVAVIVWLVCRALRGRWPAFQQALWVLVLLRLVLPPGLSHPLAAGALLDRVGLSVSGAWNRAASSGESRDATTGVPSVTDAGRRAGSRPASRGALILLTLWAATVIAFVARDSLRARAYRIVLARALAVRHGLAARLTERWRRRLGIRRAVRLVAADARMSPFTVGVLRPVVFIPSALLEPENRRALATALGHELAHVARWDVLWMRLERWLGRLYFFHPALWLASARLHAGRERLCDAIPVSHGLMSAPRYVEGLLGVLQLDLQGVEAPSLTLSQRRILMRFETVLAVRPARRSRPLVAALAAALVGCFLLPLAGADAPAQAVQPAATAVPQPSLPSLLNPLPSGHVTRPYGKGASPFGGSVEFHKGIDVAAESGTPIVAPADGIVELATTSYAPLASAGTVVILDHQDGRKTFYSHLGELKVKPSQRIARGETIALVGNTGRSTGPHVHFELWEKGGQVDPATAVSDWARAGR